MPGYRGKAAPDPGQHGEVTEPPRSQTPRSPISWWADDSSRRILAAYGRRKERRGDVLRRALHMLAIADGILDPGGRVRDGQHARRP